MERLFERFCDASFGIRQSLGPGIGGPTINLMPTRRVLSVLVALIGVMGATACAGRTEGAQAAATAFASTVTTDPAAACGVLAAATRDELESSEEEPCPKALKQLDLSDPGELKQLTVNGMQAQAVFRDDTIFLTLEHNQWVVSAAGCEPRPEDLPYKCDLTKG